MNNKELQIAKFINTTLFGFASNNAIPELTSKEKEKVISNLKNQEIDLNYIKGLTYFERNVFITDLVTDLVTLL